MQSKPIFALIVVAVVILVALYIHKSKFDIRVFYINLDRRPDRNKNARVTLQQHFRKVHRISAVDGNDIDPLKETERLTLFYDIEENQRWDKSITWFRSHRLSNGEIGCCLSHRNLWEMLHDKRVAMPVIISEDDVVLHPEFRIRFNDALMQLPDEWDIVYLGCINPGGVGEKRSKNLRRVKFVFGTYCYMLSDTGLKKLLAHLPIDRPIDNFIGNLIESGDIVGLAIWPRIADQIEYGGSRSDIDHTAHDDGT